MRALIGKGPKGDPGLNAADVDLVLSLETFGIVGDNNTVPTSSYNDMVDAVTELTAKGGVTLYAQRPTASGYTYKFADQPLPSVDGLSIRADSMDTVLQWTSGPMLEVVSGTPVRGFLAEHIGLQTTGDHLIDLGLNSTFAHALFHNVEMISYNDAASLMYAKTRGTSSTSTSPAPTSSTARSPRPPPPST